MFCEMDHGIHPKTGNFFSIDGKILWLEFSVP